MKFLTKTSLVFTVLGLVSCSSIGKTEISSAPVKSIDIYVTPYYSAENGKATNVFVYPQIDPLLRQNTLQGYQSAVKVVEEEPARVTPMTMFTLAARAYDFGLRDEAVTWFYRAQNRLITALYVLDLPKQTVAEYTGFGQLVGQFINPYAFCNLTKQRKMAEEAINWTINHPYEALFIKKIPSKFQDRHIALKEAEQKLRNRLKQQDEFFANPQNKAKWEQERLKNKVNERFCW